MEQVKSVSPFRKATRKNMKLKLGLAGASGSGKTYSALQVAKGFLGTLDNVVVIDTEQSADLYCRLGGYTVLDFKPPFDPRRYCSAIDLCVAEGFDLIIIDSVTKAWDGEGGVLDIHSKLGGGFRDWAKATPIHDAFLQKLVHAPINIITTVRKKQDYAMVEKNGKMGVEKLGLKDIQRDGFEYELTAALNLNMEHVAEVSKDRTGIFETICPVILGEDHGKQLRAWCEGN